jgi:hypothetical protein
MLDNLQSRKEFMDKGITEHGSQGEMVAMALPTEDMDPEQIEPLEP